MLSRKYTFRTTYYRLRAKDKGKKYNSENMFAYVYKRKKTDDVSKFGFVISKKISALAVQRNRIRRAMSETVRQNIAFLKDGYDIVYVAKATLAKKSTGEIMKETSDLLKTANLLK